MYEDFLLKTVWHRGHIYFTIIQNIYLYIYNIGFYLSIFRKFPHKNSTILVQFGATQFSLHKNVIFLPQKTALVHVFSFSTTSGGPFIFFFMTQTWRIILRKQKCSRHIGEIFGAREKSPIFLHIGAIAFITSINILFFHCINVINIIENTVIEHIEKKA